MSEERRFAPYPEYSDSNIEWFGKIPKHWHTTRLKMILDRNDSGVWGDDPNENAVMVLRSTDINVDGEWSVTNPARRTLTKEEFKTALLMAGDLVMTKSSGSALHLGKTAMVTEEIAELNCCFSNFMQRLRLFKGNEPRFFNRLLNSHIGREQLNYFGSTTTGLANINRDVIGSLFVPLLELEEQRVIADFLDREIAKIDAMIGKKERLIALLKEKRTALITHAVTKGLDPTVPLQDSGIDWLGKVPAHWEVRKFKHEVVIRGGQVDPRIEDIGTMVLISPNHIESKTGRILGQETAAEQGAISGKYEIEEGDIIYCKIRPELAKACIAPCDGLCSADMYALVPKEGNEPKFILYLLLSDVFTRLAVDESMRVKMPKINREALGEIMLPFPDWKEQTKIVSFIESRLSPIDYLVEKTLESIKFLCEYRIALISAAVTGRIDVREEVA